MPNPQNPIRMLAITANELMLELIKTAIERDETYFYLEDEIQQQDDQIIESIEKLAPDYILLDYMMPGVHPVDIIDSVSLQFPGTVIIVILPEDQVSEANRVILAGARAFIVQPFNQNQLLSVLGRVRELQLRNQETRQSLSDVEALAHRGTFVVFSPKGGVGCSSVAVNLAASLQRELRHEVLLLDGKLLFGDLDIMLNVKTQNSISDLIPHVGSLDETLVRDVVSEHVSGLKILPAPTNPTVAHGIHPEDLHKVLNALQSVFQYVVIDSGNFLSDNTVTFMDSCQKIILVISPDIACLRDASRFFEICRTTLSFPKEKILVVVNQYEQKDGLSLTDIERTLQVKVFATLPWDRKTSLQSINRGIPIVLQSQKSSLRKSFESLAKNLAAMLAPVQADAGKTKRALPDVLSKTSRLG
jgi:pilus assembly protein CpaE